MDIIKLGVIFFVIVVVLKLKKPLYIAIILSIVSTSILFNVGVFETIKIGIESILSFETISILIIFYLITFLQRMLEKRKHLEMAQKSLNGIFNNRRVNASLAPMFIGLLPSAGAVTICAEIVDSACGDYLTKEEKTFVTSFFRHVPESFLPTYSSIIIALGLTNNKVSVSAFLIGMFPMVVVMVLLGYIFYLRKIPKETGQEASKDKKQDIKNLFKSLWSIGLAIILIVGFKFQVYTAVVVVIVMSIVINKFKFKELKPMFKTAFEFKIMINTVVIMIFKNVISSTGVITSLPEIFSKLPIPSFLIFALIFFCGTIVSGATAIIVLCMPLVSMSVPDAGLPLFILLMNCTYAAMQISPTHICLTIVCEYFKVELGQLIKKTIPVVISFIAIALLYYLVLSAIF